MALQISEKNEIFYVEGKIKTETIKSFLTYFDYTFNNNNKIVMNIDKVSAIDIDGLKAIKALDKTARINNKLFYIVGYGSKDIYEDIESTQSQVA